MKNLPRWILLLLITLPLSFFSIILCLFMFSNSCIPSYSGSPALSLDGKPILRQFHVFTCASGSIHIVQEVTSECEKLGILLWLPPPLVSNTMSSKAHGNIEDKCRNIIDMWLKGKGKLPVIWRTFIDVLKEMKYLELADNIFKELSKSFR